MSTLRLTSLLISLLFLNGCSGISENMASNLAAAIKNNNDLEIVKAGSPSYLIMIDSFLEDDPNNEEILRIAADLNATYAEIFIVGSQQRARLMTAKALTYAQLACCNFDDNLCNLATIDFQQFSLIIDQLDNADDLPFLFSLGSAWVGWVQVRRDDFKAIAQISKIEKIMTRIVEIDEKYMNGGAHLYLGSLAILLPPSIGGKPEVAQKHFLRAIELGGEHNLIAKVIYAEKYGRMMFDQELHDRLLQEVLAADPTFKGYTLSNVLAQKRAKKLLASGTEYF